MVSVVAGQTKVSGQLNYKYEKKKRILIIEQEDDLREILSLSLELFTDWEVLTASSDTQGLAIATTQQPGVIVVSTSMSKLKDCHIIEDIQNHHLTHDIPIILMADRIRLADQCQFTQQGVAAVINTGNNPKELACSIDRILNV